MRFLEIEIKKVNFSLVKKVTQFILQTSIDFKMNMFNQFLKRLFGVVVSLIHVHDGTLLHVAISFIIQTLVCRVLFTELVVCELVCGGGCCGVSPIVHSDHSPGPEEAQVSTLF